MNKRMAKPTNWCAFSEDTDQPGHPPSLISVFAVSMKKACALSYQMNAQRRLWSAWASAQADLSLRWVHAILLVCRQLAQIKSLQLCRDLRTGVLGDLAHPGMPHNLIRESFIHVHQDVFTESNDSVSGQRRPWSDCTDAKFIVLWQTGWANATSDLDLDCFLSSIGPNTYGKHSYN